MTLLENTLKALNENYAIRVDKMADLREMFAVLDEGGYRSGSGERLDRPNNWWEWSVQYYMRWGQAKGKNILSMAGAVSIDEDGRTFVYERGGVRNLDGVISWDSVKNGVWFIY